MSFKKISTQEAIKKFDSKTEFIDIREEEERDNGFIPGSNWIPISELNGRMDELPEEEEAVVEETAVVAVNDESSEDDRKPPAKRSRTE